MPLRRQSAGPSPRLRALLERASAEQPTAGRPTGGVTARGPADGVAANGAATRGAAAPPLHPSEPERPRQRELPRGRQQLWQPERSWLELPDAEPATEPATEARRPGRHRRARPPGPAWLVVPDSLRGARWSSARLATAGLLLVVLVAALVFAGRVALARASSQPRPVSSSSAAAGTLVRGSSTFASSPTGAGGGGPPTPGPVTVHVVGQVRRPGVVQLPAGSRVADALAKAGGALKGADLGAINLARVLVDGEQVRVPRPGEVPPGPDGAAGSGVSGPAGSSAGAAGGLVNLNTATAEQLEELPGVGPVLAQRILDWRTEHGRFTSVDELGEVSGIGEKIFAQLQPKVTVR